MAPTARLPPELRARNAGLQTMSVPARLACGVEVLTSMGTPAAAGIRGGAASAVVDHLEPRQDTGRPWRRARRDPLRTVTPRDHLLAAFDAPPRRVKYLLMFTLDSHMPGSTPGGCKNLDPAAQPLDLVGRPHLCLGGAECITTTLRRGAVGRYI